MADMGMIIDGKYEILKQIGKGGMSSVYLAMDRRLNKPWAVKEIRKRTDGRKQTVMLQSLLAEANLMKTLDHPALPRIVDIIDGGEMIFIIMDYIEGESLDKILRAYGPQPQERVIDWGKQLCDVLEYLHSRKPPVIYRDMKPANIMLKPEGRLKLIDFGIARQYKDKNETDTVILGTKGYAPPEQHGSRQTDARSDIYALGMTLHHLLTGADPRREGYGYASIRRWNPELSGGLERIIDKCTALDPEERYRNCGELMYALGHYEEEDGEYRRKQRRRLGAFAAAAACAVVLALTGSAAAAMGVYERNRDYELKISISASTPYETRVSTYLDAIGLAGGDVRAYRKLLEAYREKGVFGEKESSQFTAKYNLNKGRFSTDTEEYLDLMFEAGTAYFYLYSGGDNSFRTRVLKAYPYFQAVAECGDASYKYFAVSESYRVLGEFYAQYVVNAASIREPSKAAYAQLMDALRMCVENLDAYDYDDAAYIRLTMYREIANLLNDHRRGLAESGVDIAEVMGLLETTGEKTRALSVTQQASLEIRDFVLEACEKYAEDIERAYSDIGIF